MSIIFIPTFILMVQFFFLINHLKYDHSIRKDSSAQIKISFIFLGALYCLRSSHIGNDTETYADLFEKVKFFPFTQLDIFSPRFELGFIYLNKISSLICDNFFFLQIIVGLFVYSITYKFVKEYSPYVGMTIIVFFFVRYHDAYMNIMRQAIARFFQCSRQCCDDTWDAVEPVKKMYEAMTDGTFVPDELIPHCPHCGAEAFPWVRGYGNFLQGRKYDHEYQKMSKYLEKNKNKRLLFIELGVGRMTPMFIQEPFWHLTGTLPDAYYVSVNDKYNLLPKEIEEKGIVIVDDIAKVLGDVRAVLEGGLE